jgi:Trk-type K+ transport system membrane component
VVRSGIRVSSYWSYSSYRSYAKSPTPIQRRSQLTKENAKTIAIILSTLGILFSLAMAFKIMPFNIALFGSGSCFVLAGAVSRIGRERG